MADGAVRQRAYAEQGRDFTGLQFGRITPTDVDGLIDFQGRFWVFIEVKYGGVGLPLGQRIALERLTDALQRGGCEAAVLIGRHTTPPEDQIDVGACEVTEYRYRGRWRMAQRPLSMRAAIDALLARMSANQEVA